MSIILAFEQGGNALRLVSQNNGYLQLVYAPKSSKARCLGLFEETLMSEALDAFHTQAEALATLLPGKVAA